MKKKHYLRSMNSCLGVAAAVFMAYKKGWFPLAMTTEQSIVISMPQKTFPPEAYLPDRLPAKLQRYRHPGHKHRMFLSIVRFPQSVICDNQKCNRAIQFCETVLTCPQCDLDICAHCFSQPLDSQVEPVSLAENDSKINEDIMFSPYRFESEVKSVSFRAVPQKKHKRNGGTPCIHDTVPNQPLNPAQRSTFSGVLNDDEDEDDEYEEEDDDDDDDENGQQNSNGVH